MNNKPNIEDMKRLEQYFSMDGLPAPFCDVSKGYIYISLCESGEASISLSNGGNDHGIRAVTTVDVLRKIANLWPSMFVEFDEGIKK